MLIVSVRFIRRIDGLLPFFNITFCSINIYKTNSYKTSTQNVNPHATAVEIHYVVQPTPVTDNVIDVNAVGLSMKIRHVFDSLKSIFEFLLKSCFTLWGVQSVSLHRFWNFWYQFSSSRNLLFGSRSTYAYIFVGVIWIVNFIHVIHFTSILKVFHIFVCRQSCFKNSRCCYCTNFCSFFRKSSCFFTYRKRLLFIRFRRSFS